MQHRATCSSTFALTTNHNQTVNLWKIETYSCGLYESQWEICYAVNVHAICQRMECWNLYVQNVIYTRL